MKKKIKIIRSQFAQELEENVNLALKDLPEDTKVSFTSYEIPTETGKISVMKVALLEWYYDDEEEEITHQMEAFGKAKLAEMFSDYPEKWWDSNALKWVTRESHMKQYLEMLVDSDEWKNKLAEVTKTVKPKEN